MHQHKEHTNFTDEELIHRYRTTSNNEWLGVLLQKYTALLFGVALKYLKNSVKAEDAVQQIHLKVLTHFPQENIANFKGWLYILMRNQCLHELKKDKHNVRDDDLSNIADSTIDSEDATLQYKSLEQLSKAIEQLNEEQKTCVVLFYLKLYSYEQIIKATGYTFMQVKSYIQNGKRNLKMILSKTYQDISK